MGFFDRLAAKKNNPAQPQPPAAAAPTPAPDGGGQTTTPNTPGIFPENPAPASAPAPSAANVKALLLSAREKLEFKDIAGAMLIYEELLRIAGDRPDVLVTLSGDLGSCGYVNQIVELVAPRYDADRHGPATGINLLQAYLATHNTTAAQHLLDILFGLQRPELEERLYGFSNALAELLEAERRGALPPPSPLNPNGVVAAPDGEPQAKMISLVSISRPIWAYGLEAIPGVLPQKQGKLRRVAFGQLAILGTEDYAEKMKQPEDALGRFTRGFPLWLAETFYFSPHYAPIAAVGMLAKDHYAIFPSEWTPENIRQLVETASEGLDYVFTGAIKQNAAGSELVIRVWEVKKLRERKQFTARWTPATADAELTKLHEQIRLFMEWSPYPAGPAYTAPAKPTEWCDTLSTSLACFLADKTVLPQEQIAEPDASFIRVADRAAQSEKASLTWLTLVDRATRLGFGEILPHTVSLAPGPLVEQAREAFGA